MASKWDQLQQQFLIEHKISKITVKEWCAKNGLKYATARRYIKATPQPPKPKIKTAPKKSLQEILNKKNGIYKHGGYSLYFDDKLNKLASSTELEDELTLCRARIHLVVKTIEEIHRRLEDKGIDVEIAASLYESLFKADLALDRNIARVESITKTLSSLRLEDLQVNKMNADIQRSLESTQMTVINAKKSIAQTELTQLQIKQAQRDLGGDSKLDKLIDNMTGDDLDKVVG